LNADKIKNVSPPMNADKRRSKQSLLAVVIDIKRIRSGDQKRMNRRSTRMIADERIRERSIAIFVFDFIGVYLRSSAVPKRPSKPNARCIIF